MATGTLYEQIVDHTGVASAASVGDLIALSELSRAADAVAYADKLRELMLALEQPGARLQRQPMFEWETMQSPCFRFEYHRALMKNYDAALAAANAAFVSEKFDEAAETFASAAQSVAPLVCNISEWTAISPELRRAPPFHLEFLLSLAARAKCRQHHAAFAKIYDDPDSGVGTWKHGAVASATRKALESVREACRFCALANLLWARPEGSLGVTTSASAFETELVQAYHRVASYCADSFQKRLDHASACADAFEDCRKVLSLNQRLYYLTAKDCAAPPPADVSEL